MDILIVVDMQNDFVTGALGSDDARAIVPRAVRKIQSFSGEIIFTRDTHGDNYLETLEGKKLPVKHCIAHTKGWELIPEIQKFCHKEPVDKPAFGSFLLGETLRKLNEQERIRTVTLIGLCTDICVISNAVIAKASLPDVEIIVDAACCAGSTKEGHQCALEAMSRCQICIENQQL